MNVAKHMVVMKLLLHIRTTHPDEKILVFSHSVLYLKWLFDMLDNIRLNNVRTVGINVDYG